MTTRSAQLGTVVMTNTGVGYGLGTVPTGEVWILKSIILYNGGAGAATVQAYVYGTGPVYGLLVNQSIAAGATVFWQGWVVLKATDQIITNTTVANVHVWVSGTRLLVS